MPHGPHVHPFHIHPFLRPDHLEVADIWVASWDHAMPALRHGARHDWVFHQLEAMHDTGAQTWCALNTRTGGIAGFATVDVLRRKLLHMAVAVTARGSGLAQRLLDHAKAQSPSGLSAHVPVHNERARRFFAREGFAEAASEVDRDLLSWSAATAT